MKKRFSPFQIIMALAIFGTAIAINIALIEAGQHTESLEMGIMVGAIVAVFGVNKLLERRAV
jgi:hypothetical protein